VFDFGFGFCIKPNRTPDPTDQQSARASELKKQTLPVQLQAFGAVTPQVFITN
jgi:hypothetical protein